MKLNNLFKVLVLGGAALSANTSLAQESNPTPTEEVKAPAFCGQKYPGSCVPTIVDGNKCAIVPAPGLECCWGTSCDD
jgi:hypothetical protein